MIKIIKIPVLSDNYSYIVIDKKSKITACIDPPVIDEIVEVLKSENLNLDYIINTHHHHDHVGGNIGLQKIFNCKIMGNHKDQNRIPGINIKLENNKNYSIGESEFIIIDTPGHTVGHICLYFEENDILFSGDTLFSLGCGRLFEGSVDQMVKSLKKLRSLPEHTKIYCGHEYTRSNANFAIHLNPDNDKLKQQVEHIENQLKECSSTIPFKLKEDIKFNPFLNFDNPNYLEAIGFENLGEFENFKKIRIMKDEF